MEKIFSQHGFILHRKTKQELRSRCFGVHLRQYRWSCDHWVYIHFLRRETCIRAVEQVSYLYRCCGWYSGQCWGCNWLWSPGSGGRYGAGQTCRLDWTEDKKGTEINSVSHCIRWWGLSNRTLARGHNPIMLLRKIAHFRLYLDGHVANVGIFWALHEHEGGISGVLNHHFISYFTRS